MIIGCELSRKAFTLTLGACPRRHQPLLLQQHSLGRNSTPPSFWDLIVVLMQFGVAYAVQMVVRVMRERERDLCCAVEFGTCNAVFGILEEVVGVV